MKRLKFILTMLVTAMLFTSMYSCENIPWQQTTQEDDSTQIVESTTDVWNFTTPTFTNVESVLQYQSDLVQQALTDSIFRQLSTKTITDVVTVCLKNHSSITIKDIVTEFIANHNIYSNLPQNTTTLDVQTTHPTPTENFIKPVPPDISQLEKDTIINGRKIKMQYYD